MYTDKEISDFVHECGSYSPSYARKLKDGYYLDLAEEIVIDEMLSVKHDEFLSSDRRLRAVAKGAQAIRDLEDSMRDWGLK